MHVKAPNGFAWPCERALWSLAANIEYHTLSALFGIGRSTVGAIVVETTVIITSNLLSHYVSFPTGEKLRDVVANFQTRWGFPQVAGAIDGSHLLIVRPSENASDYYNRKGYYSVIMQAVVDYRKLILLSQKDEWFSSS